MKCECGHERFMLITLPVTCAGYCSSQSEMAYLSVSEDMDFLVCEGCGNMKLAPHDIERLKEEILK